MEISLVITVISMVSGGVWIVATVKSTTSQLVQSVDKLTAELHRLSGRIDNMEHDHADMRERVARLEGPSSE